MLAFSSTRNLQFSLCISLKKLFLPQNTSSHLTPSLRVQNKIRAFSLNCRLFFPKAHFQPAVKKNVNLPPTSYKSRMLGSYLQNQSSDICLPFSSFGMQHVTKIFPNANDANTTFVSEKTGFKKIATGCVCSELLKYIIC